MMNYHSVHYITGQSQHRAFEIQIEQAFFGGKVILYSILGFLTFSWVSFLKQLIFNMHKEETATVCEVNALTWLKHATVLWLCWDSQCLYSLIKIEAPSRCTGEMDGYLAVRPQTPGPCGYSSTDLMKHQSHQLQGQALGPGVFQFAIQAPRTEDVSFLFFSLTFSLSCFFFAEKETDGSRRKLFEFRRSGALVKVGKGLLKLLLSPTHKCIKLYSGPILFLLSNFYFYILDWKFYTFFNQSINQ